MPDELTTLLKDRRLRRAPVLLFVLTFVAMNVATAAWHSALKKSRRDNLMQPEMIAEHVAGARWDGSVGTHLGAYWKVIPDARNQPLVILSGMSQMYVINDHKGGDETISEFLDDYYRQHNTRVFGLAAPNLDNEEALLLLLASLSAPETTPHVFIYGICFDKFRNVGVRTDLQKFSANLPGFERSWRDLARGAFAKYPLAAEAMLATVADVNAKPAMDSSFEQRLRARFSSAVPLMESRVDLNAFFQERLYVLRNAMFRISSTTKRPVLQVRYDTNREFLGLLADVAAAHQVRLVLYVIPLNPRAETPYVPSQYEAFKDWVSDFARSRNIPYANLENAVPVEDWGLIEGQPDYKHFKESGHRLTADAIREQFDSVISNSTQARISGH